MIGFRSVFSTLLVVVATLAVVTVYSVWPSIHSSLRTFKLVPLAEPLTELYFNDTDTLPQSSKRELVFSFTIRNLEGTDMIYPYVVRAEYADGTSVEIDRNTIPIAHEDAVSIPQTHTLAVSGKARIVVELPENQRISFLLE